MSPARARVLLVDDDQTFRTVMVGELGRRGFEVTSAATGAEALEQAGAADFDVILLDLRLPDRDGIEVLQALRERGVGAGVVMLTGHGTIDTAIQAIRLGAQDYLEKPCPLDKIEVTIQRTHEHLRTVERKRVLEDGFSPANVGADIVGASPAYKRCCQLVERFAVTDETTLVLGETGVGKEMVAKLLHASSNRRDQPFVVVNCAAIQEELLQSELFGHEKGAFTGATRQKHGLFEVASGGTIFLDEIGDTSPELQAKLLRVLETGRFRRVGGTREVAVDVRVVSATNRDLKQDAASGRFREDLYFRLSTLTIVIPPLRERPEDIRVLVEHFSHRFNARMGTHKRLSAAALDAFMCYRWPGNVRELIHTLKQAMLLADDDLVAIEDLPPGLQDCGEGVAGDGPLLPLAEVKRAHILTVMRKVDGNRARAARILQISERNLYRLLKDYGWSEGDGGTGEDSAEPA